MNTDFDALLLDSELDAIEGFDMGEFGFEVEEPVPMGEDGQGAGLAQEFGFVPFSVIRTTSGDWRQRKEAWLALGIRSEIGRGGVGSSIRRAGRAHQAAVPGVGPLPLNRRKVGASR